MRAHLITGNPGSGKSTLAAELSRRGLIALDADDLAFWEDGAGIQVDQPDHADDDWRLAHRWVWSHARMVQAIAAATDGASSVFFCGIARNQAEMLDLFDKAFLLMIDDDTQTTRLAPPSQTTAPDRTDAMKQQIRDGRPIFQAEMLSRGAIPLDGTVPAKVIADRLLTQVDFD